MPARARTGPCIVCGKLMPDEVPHQRRGMCNKCSVADVRARQADATCLGSDGTIPGVAATAVMRDASRGASGLAELMLGLMHDRFLLLQSASGDVLHVLDQRSVWVRLSGIPGRALVESVALSGIAELAREAQAAANPKIEKEWLSDSRKMILDSIGNMSMVAERRGIQWKRLSDMDKQSPGVFLLLDGILIAEEPDKLHTLDAANKEWNMTDKVVLQFTKQEGDAICKLKEKDIDAQTLADCNLLLQWHEKLFSEVAYRLRAPVDKGVDCYTNPTSQAGKTTTAENIEAALPGLVKLVKLEQQSFHKQKWSVIGKELASSLVTIFDECGSIPISRETLVDMTGPTVWVEGKGEQGHTEPRRGTGLLLGADWVFMPGGAQGVDSRTGQVWRSEDAPDLRGVHERLENNTIAHRYIARMLLEEQAAITEKVYDQDAADQLKERSLYSPLEQFLYICLDPTGDYKDEFDIDELTSHKMHRYYGVVQRRLYSEIIPILSRVHGPVSATDQIREGDKLIGLRGYKILWNGRS